MFSYYSTVDEVNSSDCKTAVLPIGSTEQHGPHLPLATDVIIAGSISSEISKSLNAFLLPTLPISTCREHMGKKGSVWMNPDTFYYMVRDIVLSLKEQGFEKVIIVIGHGGIFMANPVIRELNATNPDIKVIKLDFLPFLNDSDMADILECRNNLHACEYETSLMLYLQPELVREDLIEDCVPEVPRDFLNYAPIFKYSKNGVWGMPSLASKEKGEKLFKLLIGKSISYINRVLDIF